MAKQNFKRYLLSLLMIVQFCQGYDMNYDPNPFRQVAADINSELDRDLIGPRRRLNHYPASVEQGGTCIANGAAWNRCSSGYNCQSCKYANRGFSCPASTNQGCTTQTNCFEAFQPVGFTALSSNIHNVADAAIYQTLIPTTSLFTNSNANCPVQCYIIGSTSNPFQIFKWDQAFTYQWNDTGGLHPALGYVTMNPVSPYEFKFKKNVPFYLQLEFECDNGFNQHTNLLTIQVQCHGTSTVTSNDPSFTLAPTFDIVLSQAASLLDPNYTFKDFVTSEPHCPIISRTLYADTALNAASTDWHPEVTKVLTNVQTDPYYYIEIISTKRWLKGTYPFNIRACANGGYCHNSGNGVLTVQCGPASTNITESVYDGIQRQEVGSIHGFYFDNFTSYSDCPALIYQAVTPAVNSLVLRTTFFSNAANIHASSQNGQMVILPLDNTIQTFYQFKILVECEGGYRHWTATKTLHMICFPELITITEPVAFPRTVIFYKGLAGQYNTYQFNNFTSSNQYCGVYRYELDNNNDTSSGEVMPTGLSWDPTCTTSHLCGTIRVDISAVKNYTFWIVVRADGSVLEYFQVEVLVRCGIEVFTTTMPEYLKTFTLKPPGYSYEYIRFGTDGVNSLFGSSLTQCGVVEYNLFYDEELKLPLLDETDLELQFHQQPLSTQIRLNTTKGRYWEVYLQALTEGGQQQSIKLKVAVCGLETQVVEKDNIEKVYAQATTLTANLGPQYIELDSFFKFDPANSHSSCENKETKMYSDEALTTEWVNNATYPTVELVPYATNNAQFITVWDTNPFAEKSFWLWRKTYGQIETKVKIIFEVCGSEAISLSPRAWINASYPKYNGTNFHVSINETDYRTNFTSNSRFCPLVRNYILQYYPEFSSTLKQYTDADIVMDPVSYNLSIWTRRRYKKKVFIIPTGVGTTALLPVVVEITKELINLDAINKPPYFEGGIDHIVYTVTKQNYTGQYNITLPNIGDDFDEFESFHLSSPFGGFEFDEKLGLQRTKKDQILDWVIDENNITLNFQSYFQLARKNATSEFKAILTDKRGKSSTTVFYVTFITPPEIIVIITEVRKDVLTAKILSVSENGLVRIQFSEQMVFEPLINELDPSFKKTMEELLFEAVDEQFAYLSVRLAPDAVQRQSPQNTTTATSNTRADTSSDSTSTNSTTSKSNSASNSSSSRSSSNSTRRRLLPRGFPLNHVNETLMDIYVEPFENWPAETAAKFDWWQYRFSWLPVSFINDTLELKIYWNKFQIIALEGPDQLYVKFKDPARLKSINNSTLTQKSRIMVHEVGRQKVNDTATVALTQGSESNKEFLKLMLVAVVLLGTSFGRALTYMILMINTLQLVIHLPLFGIIFPANAMIYISNMMPIVMFDVLEGREWYENIFTASGNQTEGAQHDIHWQVQELGYGTHNPFLNLGTIILWLFLYFTELIIYIFILYPFRRNSWIRPISKKVKERVFFRGLFVILLECYLELVIACVLYWRVPKNSIENMMGIDMFTAFVAVFIFLVIPGSLIYVLSRDKDTLLQQGFSKRWGTLYEGLKTSKAQIAYSLLFVFRRVIYVTIAFALRDHPGIQIIILNLFNLGTHIYMGFSKSREKRMDNFVEGLNECVYVLSVYHMMSFTDWVPSVDTRYLMGWSLIIIISLNVIGNMGLIMYYAFKDIRVLYNKIKMYIIWNLGIDWVESKAPVSLRARMKELGQDQEVIHLIWPKDAPNMQMFGPDMEIHNGEWVSKKRGLIQSIINPDKKREDDLEVLPDSAYIPIDFDTAYQPSMHLKGGMTLDRFKAQLLKKEQEQKQAEELEAKEKKKQERKELKKKLKEEGEDSEAIGKKSKDLEMSKFSAQYVRKLGEFDQPITNGLFEVREYIGGKNQNGIYIQDQKKPVSSLSSSSSEKTPQEVMKDDVSISSQLLSKFDIDQTPKHSENRRYEDTHDKQTRTPSPLKPSENRQPRPVDPENKSEYFKLPLSLKIKKMGNDDPFFKIANALLENSKNEETSISFQIGQKQTPRFNEASTFARANDRDSVLLNSTIDRLDNRVAETAQSGYGGTYSSHQSRPPLINYNPQDFDMDYDYQEPPAEKDNNDEENDPNPGLPQYNNKALKDLKERYRSKQPHF